MRHGTPITDPDTIRDLVAAHSIWYHQIELAPGIVTPGSSESRDGLELLDDLGLPADCTGKRALDIGCMDGFFSFALEARGAEVVGLDYADPEYSGFSIAQKVLASGVEHRVANVYDLTPERFGTFDIVLFLGVMYHLRNPMLALDRIRSVMEPGGELFVETQLATDPHVHDHERPTFQYFPGTSLHGDGTNTWAPNLAGLRAVLEDCEFEVVSADDRGDRGYAHARAVRDGATVHFRELDSSAGLLSPRRG